MWSAWRRRVLAWSLFCASATVMCSSSFAGDQGLGSYLSRQNSAARIGPSDPRDQKVVAGVFEDVLNYAFPSMADAWEINPIHVCWENMDKADSNLLELVRTAVEESWSRYSRLDFIGWEQCSPTTQGIRIVVKDDGPRTLGLGKRLDGVHDGMLLNFTFLKWSESCSESEDTRKDCVYSIAVHEFGHAIGFAHEQNRPDTPSDECYGRAQGTSGDTLLTPWDLHSVMNYCNPVYGNDGKLSEFDQYAVSAVYGPR